MPVRRLIYWAGSDPDRAPMSINRWGFISEQTKGDATLRYVYAGKLYQVSLQDATPANNAVVDGVAHGPAIDGAFEIRNMATGTTTGFRMLYGLAGPQAETPLRLVYRPRWWVELELDITAADGARKTLTMTELSPPRNPNTPRQPEWRGASRRAIHKTFARKAQVIASRTRNHDATDNRTAGPQSITSCCLVATRFPARWYNRPHPHRSPP